MEDTIQKIEDVSQMNNPNSKRFAIMLCDNNCLDMMRMTTPKGEKISAEIPGLALRKLGVNFKFILDQTCWFVWPIRLCYSLWVRSWNWDSPGGSIELINLTTLG